MDEHFSPSAADVQEFFARFEQKLAGDMLVLLMLCLLQRIFRAPEIGAGVGHRWVEVEGIEFIASIIMARYILACAFAGISIGYPMQPKEEPVPG